MIAVWRIIAAVHRSKEVRIQDKAGTKERFTF